MSIFSTLQIGQLGVDTVDETTTMTMTMMTIIIMKHTVDDRQVERARGTVEKEPRREVDVAEREDRVMNHPVDRNHQMRYKTICII